VDFVSTKMEDKDLAKDPAQICAAIVDQALARGSKDNISALLIFFRDGSDYAREMVRD